MKVLFLANIPSPYRVDFFNEFGKLVELTVVFEGRKATDRDDKWISAEARNYNEVFLDGIRVASDKFFSPKVIKLLKDKWDSIIVGVYATPTAMLAIEYMRIKKIPFLISSDGGLVRSDKGITSRIKRHFISLASGWLSSGEMTNEYLVHYGADVDKCYVYPFTSLMKKDIDSGYTRFNEGKKGIRNRLGLREDKTIALYVGQIIYRKGIDVLLEAAEKTPEVEYLIVGGEVESWLKYDEFGIHSNVKFTGFKGKTELLDYYQACDMFVFPTREDIWGLVIGEAMAFGLPVISTDKCVAAMELVENGENGYIVPSEDSVELSKAVKNVIINNKQGKMSARSLEIIKDYSIENMAAVHKRILDSIN